MSEDLFFIPIIAGALQSNDPKKALREAFHEIKSSGQKAEYQQMYAQFQKFMETVSQYGEAQSDISFGDAVVKELILDLAIGTFDSDSFEQDAALALIHSNKEWQNLYEQILAQLKGESETGYEVSIERNNHPVGTFSLIKEGRSQLLKNMYPGHYTLKLDTGRVIWDGELSQKDLIWSQAHPGKPLKLAADTEEKVILPKREISLLGDKIVLQVFPGVESGTLGIKIKE
jgi:hypothetical protein